MVQNFVPKMYVLKRDGRKEPVMFDKITSRIQKLCYGLNMDYIDPTSITMKVINGLYSGVTTVELDDIAAETAAMLSNEHPDYAILAARIEVSNLHKETKKSFSEVIEDLNIAGNGNNPLHTKMDEKFYEIVKKNDEVLNSTIIYDRDFSFSYFGIKIFEKEYLRKINGKIVERPQHMFMRIAVAIHGSDIPSVIETYNLISGKYYMPSESAMRNAGFHKAQLMSACCLSMKSDSIEGIYSTVKEFALLSRSGMTVGMNIHCIRAKGSYIAGTNGNSNGIMPMLRVFNGTARGSHHGGKKESSFLTIYLEPWHADIFDFLNLKRTSGKDEQRARDLSYALWVPDLFMKRVREDAEWCLMCPHDSEILQNLFGDDFEEKYTQFEREGRFNRKVKARQVWDAIYESQMETGGPMILYKDNCNRKSNQSNIGTLLSSSHTGEMMSVTSSSEIPTCASGTVCLDMFVQQDKTFDFSKLKEYVKVMTRSLNKVLDVNYYRTPSAEEPSSRNKPIAIAVQGLADVFILMRFPFESGDAKLLNQQIFETIYYGAMEASCELAQKDGPYSTYAGSPVSKGVFQFDMWEVTPTPLHDWAALKEKVGRWGVRNSLLVAPMPTASTAQILGNNESIEAYTSNVYSRRVLSGEFQVVNHHLLRDLTELGVWDDDMKNQLIAANGSVQGIAAIPDDLKKLYKTVWEISQKTVLEMAADRGAFIDQSQSLNVHIAAPNYGKLTSMHFQGWKLGLKTGIRSLHTKASNVTPIPSVTLSEKVTKDSATETDSKDEVENLSENMSALVCSLENKDDCLMCGS